MDVLLVPFSCAKKMNITFCFFSKRRESSINHRIHISRTINKKPRPIGQGSFLPLNRGTEGVSIRGVPNPYIQSLPHNMDNLYLDSDHGAPLSMPSGTSGAVPPASHAVLASVLAFECPPIHLLS